MIKPEIIIGLTFLPYDPEPTDDLPWLKYATASGRIYVDLGELQDNHPGCESWLPFEVRYADGSGDNWYNECGETFDVMMTGCEFEIGLMVREAIDAFMHSSSQWVDYWLAFESWSARCWTDLGWEYDGGVIFMGFITGLEVSEKPS